MEVHDRKGADVDAIKSPQLSLPAALAVSVGIFFALVGILSIPRMGIENYHDRAWRLVGGGASTPLDVPFSFSLETVDTIRIATTIGPTGDSSLCFTDLNATALTVSFNGTPVFRIADRENPTANIWNDFVVVPLPDSPSAENSLELEMTGTQILSLGKQPFFETTGEAMRRAALQQFLTHDLLMIFLGGSITVGILLILFSAHSNRGRIEGLLFGLTCFFIAGYGLDFPYRASSGTYFFYALLKRTVIASGFLGSFSYLAAVDRLANGRFTLTRWAAIPNAAALGWVMSSATLGIMRMRLPLADVALIIDCAAIVYLVYRKLRNKTLYVIATGLTALGITQVVLIMTVMPKMPAVLQYITAIVSILFGMNFLTDFREALRERESLRKAYNKDALTNAYNRRILGAIPAGIYASAVFLDLDGFKDFNDTHGHEAGDKVLKEFVRITRSLIRREDLVVRYGGDEFLILMKEADEDAVVKITERIRDQFRKSMSGGDVDFSYGTKPIGEDGTLDVGELDRSMYAMKERKRRRTASPSDTSQ